MGAEWPLVGREAELRDIVSAAVHKHRCVVLAGPAGVGKTRLAVECLERCKRAGLAAVHVTATSAAAPLPFGALAPLLPAFDAEVAGRVDDKADLLRRFAVTMVERAAPRRLVVFVDDAHLLDGASATLVHQLAATKAAAVVATVRSAEPAPDPVVALWKDDLADRYEVTGLTPPAVGELLSAVLAGPVDPSAVAALVDRSRGNVLFLRELVVGALDGGALRNDGGIWRLVDQLVPSDRLTELVSARLAGLTPEELALLELVAVGEPVGAGELTALGDPVIAERLERKRLLISQTAGLRLAVRFAHPLYGEVVRKQIPALRRRALARSLADAVEKTGARRREDLLRIATWRLDGGGGRPEQMLAAAVAARWHYDFALAERLARAAQSGGAGFEARLLAAQLASLQGR
ncbi:MAG TPA: AAA family ATPase, partial [Amycolatopsis sp.]|nr:AAA family ATPase [Amycolatopsis sp.]